MPASLTQVKIFKLEVAGPCLRPDLPKVSKPSLTTAASLGKSKGMGGTGRSWRGRVPQSVHDVDNPCKGPYLPGLHHKPSAPTLAFSLTVLPKRTPVIALKRAGANTELERFLVKLFQEPSITSVGLRWAGARAVACRGMACDLAALWRGDRWATVLW